MTAKTLEEKAREYATRIRPCKYKIIDYDKEQPKRWREVYEAYLTAATLRDKEIEELRAKLASMREPIWMLREEHEREIEELRAELADWRESARKASGERCEDEIHCCCVPYLRVEIDRLRARVKELEGMVPKWCEWDSDARRDMTKAGYMDSGDDELIGGKWHLLMVPPIPLPGGGMMFRVIRPDGSVIQHRPERFMEFALWAAAEVDAEVARRVRRNRLNNVQQLKRAGYSFEEMKP